MGLRNLRIVIAACLAAAIFSGVCLIVLGGPLAFAIGVVGVVASLGYAGGPIAYARTGFAEPLFFLMFGVVAVAATYYIQVAATYGVPSGILDEMHLLPWDAFVVGLPVGALVTNVLVIDDICDIAFDRAKGWRTGAMRFSIGWSRFRFVLLYILAYLAPIAFLFLPGYGPPILLPLLTLPWAWSIALKVRAQSSAADLLPQTPRASILALAYAILLAVGIGLR